MSFSVSVIFICYVYCLVTFFLDIMYNDSFGLGNHFCWVVVVFSN